MHRALICWLATCLPAFGGLKFDSLSKSVDVRGAENNILVDFTFENDGSEAAVIDRYDGQCECLGVALQGGKLSYLPGEKGKLRAEFDLRGFIEPTSKDIRIWLKGDLPDHPSITLKVEAKIEKVLDISTATLKWDQNAAAEPKTITIQVTGEDPVHVLGLTDFAGFTSQLKTVEEGRKYEVVITPQSTEKPGFGSFRLETDSKISRFRHLQLMAFVVRPGAGDVGIPGEAQPQTPSRFSSPQQRR